MRTNGRRVLPGSSLKGLLRSAVEAITTTGTTFRLSQQGKRVHGVNVTEVQNKAQTQRLEPPPALPSLTLANRLFGVTDRRYGYQAHCTFEDAPQTDGSGVIFRMLPRYRPQPDYSEGDPAITTGWQRYFADPQRTLPRGRKFYRSGQAREVRPPYTAVEACEAGSRFELRIQFHNLTSAEIGVLLLVLGANGDIPRLMAGGGKPLGLGAVRCTDLALQVLDPASYRDFETATRPFPIDEAALAARHSGEIFEAGYLAFAEIMRRPVSYTAGGDERLY
jgi:CRISPR/Cas system CSM-associated protein Csm3 (group 7 of RAMP superfamily)